MERYEGVKRNLKHIAINNFIGGIAWGLGATVGIALLVVVLGFVAQRIDIIPFVGSFASEVTKFVLENIAKTPAK